MSFKITDKILSLPPWISTTWDQILSLKVESGDGMIITLKDQSVVKIPHLEPSVVEMIFDFHAQFLEKMSIETKQTQPGLFPVQDPLQLIQQLTQQGLDVKTQIIPLNFDLSSGIPRFLGDASLAGSSSWMNFLHHNPEQSQMELLPDEILDKVKTIGSILNDPEKEALPTPHENCRCFYCQIVGAMHGNKPAAIEEVVEDELVVQEDDLKFREWDVVKAGDSLYKVSNPFDKEEQYQVFLGTPLGCTCGKNDCEHIKAVLYF